MVAWAPKRDQSGVSRLLSYEIRMGGCTEGSFRPDLLKTMSYVRINQRENKTFGTSESDNKLYKP